MKLLLQLCLLLRRQADEGQRRAVVGGIRLGRVQGRGQGTGAHGEQMAQAGTAQHLHQQPIPHPGDLLGVGGGPQVDAGKIVLAGPATLPAEQVIDPLTVRQLRAFENIHKTFLFYIVMPAHLDRQFFIS